MPKKPNARSASNSHSSGTPATRRKQKIRLSNHKPRGHWFQSRSAWPKREAPVHTLVAERKRVARSLPRAMTGAKWEPVGPTNIGGRVTSLICHPTLPETIWIGAAGGGVWRSNNAGLNWEQCWNDQDILNIGSLAIDAKDPDVLYCGTGEANLSSDSYPGVGLYKSTNAGKTWKLIAPSQDNTVPVRIGSIAIDPFDSKHIILGGVGLAEVSATGADYGGMFISSDAGKRWNRQTFISDKNYWCHSIVFDPKTKGLIYATLTERGSRSGIWRSVDGGKNWTHLLTGLPEPSRFGRTSLAISPSNPRVIYAFAMNEATGDDDLLLGVFRSTNGGDTWTPIQQKHFQAEQQISYNNAIVVHPTDPQHVICGGVNLHRTRDGGNTWEKITNCNANVGTSHYAHSDHHALVMPSAAPGRIYTANDGGVDVSENGGDTWTNRSEGLAITMFYDMDVAQSDSKVFGGGAQDNGTLTTRTGALGEFITIDTGDGGWNIIDPKDAGHIFTSAYNLQIQRYRGLDDEPEIVNPPATDDEKESVWMCYIAMDPADSKTLLTGSSRVWRTKNDGDTWQPISKDLDGSTISAIEIAQADRKRIYVGTENGGLFRSIDGGGTWSADLSSSMLPGHMITRIETDPNDAGLVYVSVANFGHSHIFRSRDGGEKWEDIDQGQLPDVPHHVVMIRPDELRGVYVGNDAGVFVFDTKTGNWSNLTSNLPNAMVIDLVYQTKEKTLFAATYGRSIWRLSLK